jgi:AraC-like DNA-binding protein
MHHQPDRVWRVADLARAVSMSRSTFTSRFRKLCGEPPLTYLHKWRMRLAQQALRDTQDPVSVLAAALGYGSESSFSHAFTRSTGVSPSRYRNSHHAAERRLSLTALFAGPEPALTE